MKKALLLVLFFSLLLPGLSLAQTPGPVDPWPPIPPEPPFPPQPPLISHDVSLRSYQVTVDIEDQVATTRIEQVFENQSDLPAEGTYIFPLPRGAVVSDLVMIVNGQPITAQILGAGEARAIYEEIVRRLRDPALLEYVGQDAIQASVFPIPPRDTMTIQIEYSHILPVDNGLVRYVFPLRTDQFTRIPVESLSVRVNARSNDAISSVYSPTHPIATNRQDDFSFTAGYETTNTRELSDFTLYYGLASETINANLLSYRESATEPGFFLLMLAPPVNADAVQILPQDVLIVLDQSGSMDGQKWEQAREAAQYVLDNLNPEDRFNVVAFSTGWRVYATDLQGPAEAPEAKAWLDTLEAIGGTDINGALTTAFALADDARQTVVLFLTDGVPTEGQVNTAQILENAQANAPANVRLFSFGVGDDVDTFLLDQLHQALNGAGTYVRPNERIDEEVASLYNRIASPVMTDIELEFEGVRVEELYPGEPLPDLFLGTQLIIAGRYRDGGPTSLVLRGLVNGERVSYIYENLELSENAGGEVTLPRLWATRRIGTLLNSIRLNGENPELVQSIVTLSLRYGIITPYTSFLIEEDDIFTQQGRENAATQAEQNLGSLDDEASGADAVGAADSAFAMQEADAAAPMPLATNVPQAAAGGPAAPGQPAISTDQPLQVVGDRTFILREGVWIDTTFNPDQMAVTEIAFLSDAYFDLLAENPEIGGYLALGQRVIFVIDGQAYEIVPEGTE
ncbi:MAG: VWA domain-containing protein [Anaerolineae bacterium]|nr:VWA domain-containing protein [Anaerolineae bacterium]